MGVLIGHMGHRPPRRPWTGDRGRVALQASAEMERGGVFTKTLRWKPPESAPAVTWANLATLRATPPWAVLVKLPPPRLRLPLAGHGDGDKGHRQKAGGSCWPKQPPRKGEAAPRVPALCAAQRVPPSPVWRQRRRWHRRHFSARWRRIRVR